MRGGVRARACESASVSANIIYFAGLTLNSAAKTPQTEYRYTVQRHRVVDLKNQPKSDKNAMCDSGTVIVIAMCDSGTATFVCTRRLGTGIEIWHKPLVRNRQNQELQHVQLLMKFRAGSRPHN